MLLRTWDLFVFSWDSRPVYHYLGFGTCLPLHGTQDLVFSWDSGLVYHYLGLRMWVGRVCLWLGVRTHLLLIGTQDLCLKLGLGTFLLGPQLLSVFFWAQVLPPFSWDPKLVPTWDSGHVCLHLELFASVSVLNIFLLFAKHM